MGFQQHLAQISDEDCVQLVDGVTNQQREAVISAVVDHPESAIVVFDPLQPTSPIVATSVSFCDMLGVPQATFVGSSYAGLLRGLPQCTISRSGKNNFASFSFACGQREVSNIGETCIKQTLVHDSGSLFIGHLSFGLCDLQGLRFVVGVLLNAGDVTARLSSARQTELAEQGRAILCRAYSRGAHVAHQPHVVAHVGNLESRCCKISDTDQRGVAFFGTRLPEYAVLLHDGCTAMRRDSDEVANGCLVLGSQPLQQLPHGLSVTVRVECVSSRFMSLPTIGMTRCQPTSSMQYPHVAKCLAESVLIGGTGEATARDQNSNFKMGFRAPPPNEVMAWSSQLPEDLKLQVGDILECIYTWEGRIQLLLNSKMVLDFDVERPLHRNSSYYAVVDVSGAASMVSLLPASEFSTIGDLSTYVPDGSDLGDLDAADLDAQIACERPLSSYVEDPSSSYTSLKNSSLYFAETEDSSLARADSSFAQAACNGDDFVGVLRQVLPVAGLAGVLVLSTAGKWHNGICHIMNNSTQTRNNDRLDV